MNILNALVVATKTLNGANKAMAVIRDAMADGRDELNDEELAEVMANLGDEQARTAMNLEDAKRRLQADQE